MITFCNTTTTFVYILSTCLKKKQMPIVKTPKYNLAYNRSGSMQTPEEKKKYHLHSNEIAPNIIRYVRCTQMFVLGLCMEVFAVPHAKPV